MSGTQVSESGSPPGFAGGDHIRVYDLREESPEALAVKQYKESLRAYTQQRFSEFKVEAESRSLLSQTKPSSRSSTPAQEAH
ncbi:hypothetical protein P7C70_g4258, partial [Phenoliferia sp. Uapishka_3]